MEIKQLNIENINEISEFVWNIQLEFNQIPKKFINDEVKKQFKKFVLDSMNDKLIFYGVTVNNKIIALIGYEENYIGYLYVSKEYQNKGIGTLLLKMVLELLRKYETVTIDSVHTAKDFYIKNGFKYEKQKKYSIGMQYKNN